MTIASHNTLTTKQTIGNFFDVCWIVALLTETVAGHSPTNARTNPATTTDARQLIKDRDAKAVALSGRRDSSSTSSDGGVIDNGTPTASRISARDVGISAATPRGTALAQASAGCGAPWLPSLARHHPAAR